MGALEGDGGCSKEAPSDGFDARSGKVMMPGKTVLHVDNDPATAQAVADALSREGLTAVSAGDGATGLEARRGRRPDLIIMELLLPDANGLDLCAQLHRETDTPVLVLSVKSEEADVVLALMTGADDYMTKPFSTRELVARVKAILRRALVIRRVATQAKTLEYAGLVIDLPARSVTFDGNLVHLTPKEFDLLYLLASQPRQVFTREQLADQVWGRQFSAAGIRTVDTHVKRIRQKLESDGYHPWSVAAVWAVGYKFEVEP
ncbi:MAG TPA: response regulator transcription factor [Armatimonadota bacterium]|nr:response regulator transcription factor [Armatimonadota bacterium]